MFDEVPKSVRLRAFSRTFAALLIYAAVVAGIDLVDVLVQSWDVSTSTHQSIALLMAILLGIDNYCKGYEQSQKELEK